MYAMARHSLSRGAFMVDGKKKIFISWSKSQSKRVAYVLKDLLPEVLEGVELFMSEQDIGPGERSMKVIEQQLTDTTYGLIVVTLENQGEPWLNFEAGALSKQVGNDEQGVPLVVPLLVDIPNPSQLTGPLSQFQSRRLDESGLKDVLRSVATLVGSDTSVIERRFSRAWPEIETKISEARVKGVSLKKPERTVDSKVDEVLEILRTLQRNSPTRIQGDAPSSRSSQTKVAQFGVQRLDDLRMQVQKMEPLLDALGAKILNVDLTPLGTMKVVLVTAQPFTEQNYQKVSEILGSEVHLNIITDQRVRESEALTQPRSRSRQTSTNRRHPLNGGDEAGGDQATT